jgi:hypothetical protein
MPVHVITHTAHVVMVARLASCNDLITQVTTHLGLTQQKLKFKYR